MIGTGAALVEATPIDITKRDDLFFERALDGTRAHIADADASDADLLFRVLRTEDVWTREGAESGGLEEVATGIHGVLWQRQCGTRHFIPFLGPAAA
jgi:hypothetical protein